MNHPPAGPAEREAYIASILTMQDALNRSLAHDRTLPLLATTLTMQQLKVLLILSFDDECSGHQLAGYLDVRLGTVTGIVDRLVAQDLVVRFEDPHDRRIRRVKLAPAGRQLLDDFNAAGMHRLETLLAALDTATLRSFAEVLERIREVSARVFAENPPPRP